MSETAWRAELDLTFSRRENVSALTGRRHLGPLRVQKTLHPEGDAVCHAILVHPPGGIAGGDQLDIALTLETDAHALVTTPGASKWYRSRGKASRQRLVARIAPGATLEWLPQENIVFDAAEACLDTRLELAENAACLGWEIVCLGRTASGERFLRGQLRQNTELWRVGRLLWRERGTLAGDSPLFASPVGLAGHCVYGTMWLAGSAASHYPALLAALREVCAEEGGELAVTALPQLILARGLSASGERLRAAFIRLWQTARPLLLNRPAALPRIWAT